MGGKGSMKRVNFDTLDLNLLRVFDVVLEEANVTRASEKLGLSQPAISHALSRLRHAFDDPLFVRSAGRMVPTTLAAQLGPRIHAHLLQLRGALEIDRFDPARSFRRFNIACGDFTCISFIPKISAIVLAQAPDVQFRLLPYSADNVRDLDEGRIDMIVGNFRNVPERLNFEILVEDHVVGAMRKDHPQRPVLRDGLALPDLDYVVVDTMLPRTASGTDPFQTLRGIDQMTSTDHPGRHLFRSRGDDRSLVRTVVPTQLAAIALVAATDHVMILPHRLFESVKSRFDLASFPIPEQPRVRLGMAWHRMHTRDPAHTWLRSLFTRAAKDDDRSHYAASE
jgi:DNA-binding transcriptional LysR family regulator